MVTQRLLTSKGSEAYCVKCKARREIKVEKEINLNYGKHAISRVCSVCGTKVLKVENKRKYNTPSSAKKKRLPSTGVHIKTIKKAKR